MKAHELKQQLAGGALSAYGHLYADPSSAAARMIEAIDEFVRLYGDERDIALFSVPGRSEISGNHTDHNRGCVLAGAIDRDMIAVAACNEDGVIRFHSKGYNEDVVDLSLIDDPSSVRPFTSRALIAGVARGFAMADHAIGGYDAYSTTEVLKGSGLSSSAAFEVMVGNILNHFYNDATVSNVEIAKIAQFAENVYFGKPCGLMDQMACAVGGFVYMDFEKEGEPLIEPVAFSLEEAGYTLCIVNTGGNHANLNDDYASVPKEMKAVAEALGRPVLRGLTEADILAAVPTLRGVTGDRAILRALHFVRENARVGCIRDALKRGDVACFLDGIRMSGRSSFEYLQNVYTTKNPSEQGLSLALCATEGLLAEVGGAFRVHGGGFAGTIQAFVPNAHAAAYVRAMNDIFGEGAVMPLRIRPVGATRLF